MRCRHRRSRRVERDGRRSAARAGSGPLRRARDRRNRGRLRQAWPLSGRGCARVPRPAGARGAGSPPDACRVRRCSSGFRCDRCRFTHRRKRGDARYRLQGWTLLARPPRSRRYCRFRGRSSCRRSSRGACRVAPSGRRAASASARARSSRLSWRALPGWRSRCSPRHVSLCRDPGAHPPCATCRRECGRA